MFAKQYLAVLINKLVMVFNKNSKSRIRISVFLFCFITCQGCTILEQESRTVKEFDERLVLTERVNAPAGYSITMDFRASIIQPLLIIDELIPPDGDELVDVVAITLWVNRKMINYVDHFDITNVWVVTSDKQVYEIDFSHQYLSHTDDITMIDVIFDKRPALKKYEYLEAVVEFTFNNGQKFYVGSVEKVDFSPGF